MSSSKFNVTLTNYARGLAQDFKSSLADFIAPEVIVPAATGQYKSFDDKNTFQTVDTSRAVGGPARRLEFAADDPTYNCMPQALEIPIDDHERDEAGRGDPLGIEQAKALTLVSTARLSHEKKVYDIMMASKPSDEAFDFSDSAEDPVVKFDEHIEILATLTGRMPDRMIIPLPIWATIRHNPEVIKRFPGAASVGVTRNQFASLLLNPDLDIRVGVLSRDLRKRGAPRQVENLEGESVIIFHGNNSPTLYDPGFMKTFRIRRGGVDTVRTYREDNSRSDILAVDWTEDIKVVSPISARRITHA
jgi:hypothetical protein